MYGYTTMVSHQFDDGLRVVYQTGTDGELYGVSSDELDGFHIVDADGESDSELSQDHDELDDDLRDVYQEADDELDEWLANLSGSAQAAPSKTQTEPAATQPALASDSTPPTVTGKVIHVLRLKQGKSKGKPYGVIVDLPELATTGMLHGTELGSIKLESLTKGSEVRADISEVNEETGKVKLSVKMLQERERQEGRRKQLAAITKGAVFTGTITRTESYGVFVKFDGFQGLLHVSQLPKPTKETKNTYLESLNVGDELKAAVNKVDLDTGKVGISLLPLAAHEFFANAKDHEGQSFEGTINAVMEYGVFVDLGFVVGLLHVSKLPGSTREERNAYLAELRESYDARQKMPFASRPEPQVVTVIVSSIDTDKRQVNFSL